MNAQQHPNLTDPAAPSESAYLTQQAREASAALGAAIASLKQDLANGVSPQAWAKQYPWVAVGAAAVAGFAAASALTPSKEQQALKQLERIERALHAHPTPAQSAAPDQPHKPLASRIFSELFSALKPALSSALAAYAAHSSAYPSHHNGNGHSADPSDAAYDPQETDPNQS